MVYDNKRGFTKIICKAPYFFNINRQTTPNYLDHFQTD